MKSKAWSLVGGLVTAASIGTTPLADTLIRPAYAQHEIYEEQMVQEHEDTFLNDEPERTGKFLELDVHIRPSNSVNFAAMALFSEESDLENMESADNKVGFLEKNLSDFFDIQIFSTVYFGSKREPHQLIFDTGSSWLWVQTPECKTCATTNDFNYKESSSFKQESETLSQVSYGSGHIWGYRSADWVCLSGTSNQCVDEMSFIATTNQRGLSGMTSDGIVGLAPVARG